MSTSQRPRPLTPSSLLTALPGLLGFIPERSLIVLAFGADPHTVRTTMRHDLIFDENGDLAAPLVTVLDGLAEICAREQAHAVILVIADDRYPIGDDRYRRVCVTADRCFAGIGGAVAGFVVEQFADNARWQRVWDAPQTAGTYIPLTRAGALRGRMGDPHTSPTAVRHAVESGRRVLARRSEMQEMLRPLPHCVGPHREFGDGIDEIDDIDDGVLLRELVGHVIAFASPRHPPELDCAAVTLLGDALLRLQVRDAALVLAVTDLRHAAEALWRQLARRLRGSRSASAATMLGHLHYVNGEGGYAGVAFDHALAADPQWHLADLLDTALRGGIHPTAMREMIPMGYDVADSLGVAMPGPSVDREVS